MGESNRIWYFTLLSVAFLGFLVTIEARGVRESSHADISSYQQNHERVRRDMSGLIDMIGGLFKKDDNGQSIASNAVNGFFQAVGGMMKPPS